MKTGGALAMMMTANQFIEKFGCYPLRLARPMYVLETRILIWSTGALQCLEIGRALGPYLPC